MANEAWALPVEWREGTLFPLPPEVAFNGYVAANVIHALDRLGLLERMAHGGTDLVEFTRSTGADAAITAEVVRIGTEFGYITHEAGKTRLTDTGYDMLHLRGFFTWAVGGYSEVFGRAGQLSAGIQRFGDDVRRDEGMVALGSGQCDDSLMASILDEVLTGVEFSSVADLGSGVCARLCRVVGARPGSSGVGVDLSAAATGLAKDHIAGARLSDRVDAVQGDVLGLLFGEDAWDERVRGADLVMSFFLLHDLLASPGHRAEVIPRMRDAFPRARTFVLADTVLRTDGDGLPIFSAGFELAHALMGVPLHTRQAYDELFAAGGLRARQVLPFGAPHSWLYLLEAD